MRAGGLKFPHHTSDFQSAQKKCTLSALHVKTASATNIILRSEAQTFTEQEQEDKHIFEWTGTWTNSAVLFNDITEGSDKNSRVFLGNKFVASPFLVCRKTLQYHLATNFPGQSNTCKCTYLIPCRITQWMHTWTTHSMDCILCNFLYFVILQYMLKKQKISQFFFPISCSPILIYPQ